MKNQLKKACLFALMTFASWPSVKAATIQLTVGGFFGGNKLEDLTTTLPDNTLVDFGLFYKNTAFTSTSAIATALASVNTDAQMQTFLSDNGWVSFGTSMAAGGAGDFTLSWQPTDPATGPGFGTAFNIDPAIGNLVGKTGFVWLKTPAGTPVVSQYGLFASNAAFIAANFGADLSIDLVDTGDATTGVTALFGSVLADGISTQAVVPEPSSMSLIAIGLALLPFVRRKI
jgi:hypothetical protein